MKKRVCAMLLALLCLAGCGGSGGPRSLTESVKAQRPEVRPITAEEAAALAGFSVELLRENWKGGNALVSPLSALSALGMTANGARGETLAQMEAVLGLPVEALNSALASWTARLPKDKTCRVDLANAVWFRDDGTFQADPEFLKTAAGWYGAEVFGSAFDDAAVREVNQWLERNTHGMIDGILEEFSGAAMMCLVNALALEAEWEDVYETSRVWDGQTFTTADGREQPVTLMYSDEYCYLEDEGAQGFLKFYKGGRWAFAALLPDKDLGLDAYMASLTGERLHGVLADAEDTLVMTGIPKFQCESGVELTESLKAMGMSDAFEAGAANLSGLGSSGLGPLFISQALHKTYICVDETGTKAGAATTATAEAGAAPDSMPEVILDRPFLYMLLDTETNLPAFLGVMTNVE